MPFEYILEMSEKMSEAMTFVNPATGKPWCTIQVNTISLYIHNRELLNALTEWKDPAGSNYNIKFCIDGHAYQRIAYSFRDLDTIVFLPRPDVDPSAPYYQIRNDKVIPQSVKALFVEALKRVDAYITEKLAKLAKLAKLTASTASTAPTAREFLQEVSEGVAEIVPVYRDAGYWTSLSNASPRCGACVVMNENAKSPYVLNGILYIPTDADARAKPFRMDREKLSTMNAALAKLESWIMEDSEKIVRLKALIDDKAFVNSRPAAERHLIKALRMVMQS